jgi:hypothetical protein
MDKFPKMTMAEANDRMDYSRRRADILRAELDEDDNKGKLSYDERKQKEAECEECEADADYFEDLIEQNMNLDDDAEVIPAFDDDGVEDSEDAGYYMAELLKFVGPNKRRLDMTEITAILRAKFPKAVVAAVVAEAKPSKDEMPASDIPDALARRYARFRG